MADWKAPEFRGERMVSHWDEPEEVEILTR